MYGKTPSGVNVSSSFVMHSAGLRRGFASPV